MTASTISTADYYRGQFAAARNSLPGGAVPWLATAREQALEQFLDLGFPTLRNEDWKYTSVAAIEKSRFTAAGTVANGQPTLQEIEAMALSGAHLLVFVDGRLKPGLSRIGSLPGGATVTSIAAVLKESPQRAEQLEAYFPQDEPYSAFTTLNTAFVTDGAYIHLERGVALEAPIQLLFIASGASQATHTRNIVIGEFGSRAEIIEQHVAQSGADSAAYFTNAVTRIVAGEGAHIAHHKLQQESAKAFHIASISAQQGRGSRVASNSFALGGALVRVGIDIGLDAEDASCDLMGLYLTDGRQHVDHHTRIDHRKRRGTSRELYKGVLSGLSRAVFNGKVIVHPDAQQSDAQQSNRNLLLSEHAEIDTKPQLEIYADDVKCQHGATVGQLDPEQLFYLRTRGIDDAAARVLLTYAFAEEVVARVAILPLNAHLERLLLRRLPEEIKELL